MFEIWRPVVVVAAGCGGCDGARWAGFEFGLDFGLPESVEVELLESEGLELLASSSHSLNLTLHWLLWAAEATAWRSTSTK